MQPTYYEDRKHRRWKKTSDKGTNNFNLPVTACTKDHVMVLTELL